MKWMRAYLMIAVLMASSSAAWGAPTAKDRQQNNAGSVKTVRLALHLPVGGVGSTLRLLAEPDELTDADAYPLYTRATTLLAGHVDREKLSEWTRVKPDQLPLNEVKQALDHSQQVQQLLVQAAQCGHCNWPASPIGTPPQGLSEYRSFAWLLAVKARYEMAGGDFVAAVGTLRTGFGLARHLADGPTLLHGMVGNAVAAVMCRQIETLAEQPGSPGLYSAIGALPKPFISLEKQIQAEMDNLDQDPRFNALNRWAARRTLRPAHDRVRLLTKRLSRDLAALQCIEALRLHAAAHQGHLPQTLDQITQWKIPNDPIAEKPFDYSYGDGTAILKGPPPKGGSAREAIQYELTIAKVN